MPAYSAFLARKWLTSRWVSILGTLGVTLAVWALIVVIAIMTGLIEDIRSGIRAATPDLLVTDLPAETAFDAVEALVAPDADVAATAPRLRHHAMYYPRARLRQPIASTQELQTTPLGFDFVEVVGIDPEREAETTGFTEWIRRGMRHGLAVHDPRRPFAVPVEREEAWLREIAERSATLRGAPEPSRVAREEVPPGSLLRASPGILVSLSRARIGGLDVGQPLDLVSARFEHEAGETHFRQVIKKLALAGAFETRHPGFDETCALIHIEELRAMLGQPRAALDSIALVSDVAVRVRPGADLDTVRARLEEAVRTRFPEADVLTWRDLNAVYLGAVDQERANVKIILFAVMLLSAFLIFATLHMTVTQKVKDIGILTAMGGSPRGVQRIFVLSGTIVATVGCLVGAGSGILTAHYLNDLNDLARSWLGVELFPRELFKVDRIPYIVEASWVLQVALGAFAISLLASWLPARRASRMDPVQALAQE